MTATQAAPFHGAGTERVLDQRPSKDAAARPAYAARHELVARIAADVATTSAVQGAVAVPDAVGEWLAGLNLLAGVPFQYLVPDARMLPAESIRFFVVDPNWVAALVDGATSIGAASAPRAAALTAMRPLFATAAQQRRPAHAIVAEGARASDAATTIYSGLVMRSALVSDWPGLQIAGFADTSGTTRVPTVRLERLAPSVLIALFDGIVQHVEISEPAQALHFGVGAEDDPVVALRWIDGAHAGVQLDGNPEPTCALMLRADPTRAVLDVTASQQAVQNKLTAAYQPSVAPAVGAGALAIQLSIAAQSQPFTAAPIPKGEQHG